MTASFPIAPEVHPDEVEHRRRIAQVANGARAGKLNAVSTLTLTANVGTTTFTDARVTAQSYIGFMPTTANAAAELGNGTLYVAAATQINGSAVVTHANNAQTDRTYNIVIIG